MIRTDFEQNALDHENQKLRYLSVTANNKNMEEQKSDLLINLSLKEVGENISSTIIQIINDLLSPEFLWSPRSVITVLFKGDRMIYLGLVTLMVSLGIYLI